MWRAVEKLFGLVLLIAAASALYVVGGVVWSVFQGTDVPAPEALASSSTVEDATPLRSEATVEIRVTSHDVSRLFPGQPIVIDVVLQNLEASRARNRAPVDAGTAAAELPLDNATTPWERRLALEMTGADGASVLDDLDWAVGLLGAREVPSERRLGITPARATFVIESDNLRGLAPGPYAIRARLPGVAPPGTVRVVPLELEVLPAPARDVDQAIVTLAVAQVAALRGEPAAAIEAAETTLELNPLQDLAMTILAESFEVQGDLDRAITWYDRYLETLPPDAADTRAKLEDYIEALRQQLEP